METGLAFAGGGMPGAAAVGVLLAFEEAGVSVTHVTGTSAGAMVASLYAYGYTAKELTRIVPRLSRRYLDFDWKSILHKSLFLRPRLEGWMKGERLRNLVAELTEDNTLSALRIPCAITATDLEKGETVVFSAVSVSGYDWESDVSIADAVRASFSIPVLFRPVYHGNRVLVDGGVTANCPVRLCRALGARHVIAVDPITPIVDHFRGPVGSFSLLNKTILLNLKLQMKPEQEHADLVLYPNVGSVGAFDFRKANDCIEAGYRETMKRMDEIKKILEKM
ncbi:MAG: patatin-like phospholipase family protein [Ectobacillus sp.]